MQASLMLWERITPLFLRAEDDQGSFETLIERCAIALEEYGLSLDDVVFHRLWTRDRRTRERIKGSRERLMGGARKTASSSFISTSHILSHGSVAIEMIAFKARDQHSRRLIDFTPVRAYAHYLVQDEWLFLSGMAEEASNIDRQFDAAFAQVENALEREKIDWRSVSEASLFLERGAAELSWLQSRFKQIAQSLPPRVTFELVDGLASPEKKLEIEAIAVLAR